jgi:hypothetical protein
VVEDLKGLKDREDQQEVEDHKVLKELEDQQDS